MEIHTRSKSSLFLTEMIISILFFSIAAACCIQIFVKAHLTSQKSENLNYAQNLASSMAETMMATEGAETEISKYFPTAIITENTITLYYDKNWEACAKENSSFMLHTTFNKNTDTISGKIVVSNCIKSSEKEKESIFMLPFRYHIAQTMTKEN